jgi:predicted Zn finger-like uncharacterized protein
MFTQCPKCQSVFMVSDKDIKAHEGLVRCGNCYSVFNSSWNLTDDPRNEFVGENVNPEDLKPAASQNQNFTFNVLGQSAAAEASEAEDEGLSTQTHAADGLEQPDHELEPFPEPDLADDFHTITPAPKVKKSDESLIYFETGNEGTEEMAALVTEEVDDKPVEIEDLTLLQTPSFSSEIPSLDSDLLQLDDENTESLPNTLSDESMWPGAEVSFENDEEEINLGMPDVDVPEVEVSDADNGISMLSDFTIDEALLDKQFEDETSLTVESINEISGIDDQAEDMPLLQEPEAEDPLSSLDFINENMNDDPFGEILEESSVAEILDTEEDVTEAGKADDTLLVSGESSGTDEFFSMDSLPETTAEAFAVEDEEDLPDIESVFITSEDEDVDETYVPISLKPGEKGELLHDMDEFPEPGELSELNYEDTMQINALLDAANISQQQIESALSAAEVNSESDEAGAAVRDESRVSEESMLSHDADIDLTEALYSSDEQDGEESFSLDEEKPSFFSKLKNLLPLGMGRKNTWTEPAISDTEATQLIQSLGKSQKIFVMPRWVSKYSLIAMCSVLMVTLFGQLGYFYMDKLVQTSPLKPVLVAACNIAGCTVPEVQNLDEIEQLSSRMTALAGNGDGLKVSSVLVNRDISPQPFPAVELTLTDRAGNMISRRVITQGKYLSEESTIRMKPNEAANIDIRLRTPSIRVDGFELRAVSQNWLKRDK